MHQDPAPNIKACLLVHTWAGQALKCLESQPQATNASPKETLHHKPEALAALEARKPRNLQEISKTLKRDLKNPTT